MHLQTPFVLLYEHIVVVDPCWLVLPVWVSSPSSRLRGLPPLCRTTVHTCNETCPRFPPQHATKPPNDPPSSNRPPRLLASLETYIPAWRGENYPAPTNGISLSFPSALFYGSDEAGRERDQPECP